MNMAEFKKAGHWPTLLSSFLYFDIGFMAWVALSPLIVYITKDLGLSDGQKFTLIAIPTLSGALLRIPLGAMADRAGPKLTGTIAQIIVMVACAYVWMYGLKSSMQIGIFGLFLGLGGASFAVALPQASRWYPPQYQGIVMGIAGAGNMGVVIDALLAPTIAENYGWQGVFGFLLIPMVLILGIYVFCSKDAPNSKKPMSLSSYFKVFKDRDSLWFMFFYFITFGGFIGLSTSLPLYFKIQHSVSGVSASLLVAFIITFGSTFRPVGGYFADRLGGVKLLTYLFLVIAACYLATAFMPMGVKAPIGTTGWTLTQLTGVAWYSVLIFIIAATALGMGNGAVFQLIPQRFAKEIGVMTGIVGCTGGIGGFMLAQTMGISKDATGSFQLGFTIFSVFALLGFVGLMLVKLRWRTTWGAQSGARI